METNTRTLVLIRHAKAERRRKENSDSQRELTRKGIEDFRKILPVLTKYLAASDSIRLYTSNKARSVQTAEILASSLKIPETIRADFVGSGEPNEFVQLIQEMPTGVSIIVGHEPFLGEWSRLLCGQPISFQKGMAVGFQLTPEKNTLAVPVWAVPPGALCEKDVDVSGDRPAWKVFRNFVYSILNEILLLQHDFDERPNEPETVHQLRIKIRSLRSMLSFLKPLLEQEKYKAIQQNLQNLLRETGHLRDLDVFIRRWETRTDNHCEQPSRESNFLTILKKEREIAAAESHKKLSHDLYPVVSEIWNWMSDLHAGAASRMSATVLKHDASLFSVRKFCNLRVDRWVQQILQMAATSPFSDEKSLHKLRILVKKLRYVLFYISGIKHLRCEIPLDHLNQMQLHLGEYCDLQNGLSILKSTSTQHQDLDLEAEILATTEHQNRLKAETISYLREIGKRFQKGKEK